jgi:cob(I)alamin adenosyltransferase
MKLYTKTGDAGSTGLIGGKRVPKNHLRIEAYGCVDELNSVLGFCRVNQPGWVNDLLAPVQHELFVIGSHLALDDTQDPSEWKLPELSQKSIARLEKQIDHAEDELPKLKNFILPGGTELAARLHIARTVARRAERSLVSLSEHAKVDAKMMVYLNRLSDWLFASARLANHRAGVADVIWES